MRTPQEKLMKKETVTLKNVKKDIRDYYKALKSVLISNLTLILTVAVIVTALLTGAYLTSEGEGRSVLLAFTVVLCVCVAVVLVCFAFLHICAYRRTSDFYVIRQRLDLPAIRESEVTVLTTDFGGKGASIRTEKIQLTEKAAVFDVGIWIVPAKCFVRGKTDFILGDDMLHDYGKGSEYYVVYGEEREVYYAYPVDMFELSEDLAIKEDKGL